ncbi:cation:H+ antiporter [Halogranum gelatinilyticum]|uniref:Cation:H+ antiporter n=1 Tax=Halogranum gelatinilyticum TaxID=660521 RepID=A0A1G9UTE6_9EURY|nr:calcium/sodium antiporter [Halogranum gelatinilyticum]SDM63077.1 cation:H+ antiporter [Halogranum gelatinilyticum]
MTDLFVPALLFAVSILGLWLGAEWLVSGAAAIARRFGISELVIGLTVVAFGTGLPEAVVTIDAAITGRPDIAVGNVVGSNIVNIAVVLGVVAIIRAAPVSRSLVRRDGTALVATTVLAVIAAADGSFSRLEGGLLLTLWLGYLWWLFRNHGGSSARKRGPSDTRALALAAAKLVVGLVVVVGSGAVLVDAATTLARSFGISEWTIGATVVAVGTSTPELVVSLLALYRGRTGLSLGNVIGSNIVNLFGVLGVAAAIQPITVNPAAFSGMLWLLALVGVFVVALWTGHRLSRVEGGALLSSEVVRWVLGFG